MAKGITQKKPNGKGGRPQGHLGFEATLWARADKLRGNLDAAEYKHVVLGLNGEESRTLAALRDALLPKLLSGELRVVK